MKKKLISGLVLAFIMVLVSASTASATGYPPDPEEVLVWKFNDCGPRADTLTVTSLSPYVDVNSIWVWNDTNLTVGINWWDQNPFSVSADHTIENSGFLYSFWWGGWQYWMNTGAPDPCPAKGIVCHLEGKPEVVRLDHGDGTYGYYDHFYFTVTGGEENWQYCLGAWYDSKDTKGELRYRWFAEKDVHALGHGKYEAYLTPNACGVKLHAKFVAVPGVEAIGAWTTTIPCID